MHAQTEFRDYSETAEVKRVLATASTLLPPGGKGVLAVTSATRGEGKTHTAISIAMAYALSHRDNRVLLVDMNWHDPSVHESFGISLQEETVFGDQGASLRNLVCGTMLRGLDVLAPTKSVVKASLDYDNSAAFSKVMLDEARELYDMVVVDTRSFFPSNREMRIDPVQLCMSVDCVVFVALAGVTPRQEVKRAVNMLQTAGTCKVGLVLNQWRNPLEHAPFCGMRREGYQ